MKMETLKKLNEFEKKIFSQNGEDGILEQIFNVIGTSNKYYVEFGVENGSERCTRYLQERYGWSGLLMDGQYPDNQGINLHHEYITCENINKLFEKYEVPNEFDLLSIDVDYNDFYLWEVLDERYKPRVIIVEYNADFSWGEDRLVPYGGVWDGSNYFGASILAFDNLARKKGYTLLASDSKGVNLFFIRNDLLGSDWERKPLKDIYYPSTYGDDGRGKGHRIDPYDRPYISSTQVLGKKPIKVNNICSVVYNPFPDSFRVEVYYLSTCIYKIHVRRVDRNEGWGLPLKIVLFDADCKKKVVVDIGKWFQPEKVMMCLADVEPLL